MKTDKKQSAGAAWLPAASRLRAAALALGLMTSSVLALDDNKANDKSYDNSKQPHESPHKAEPPTGGHASLADAATNPIASLVTLQFQDQYNFSNYNSDGGSNSFTVQPVIPFKLNWDAVPTLITRTTIPFVTTPDLGDPVGRNNGLGDVLLLAIALPKIKLEKQMIGIGASISAPTATSDFTGSGKWSMGPAFVYMNLKTPHWQWGVLGWQLWDIAGDDNRNGVNETFFQPLLIRHFDKGWYAGLPDVPGTYNWNSNNITFPFGLRIGRVMKIGKQPVNIFGQAMGNAWADGPSARWSFKLNVAFLFPD